MGRVDVRVKGFWKARWEDYAHKEDGTTVVADLSLGGAFLRGEVPEDGRFVLRLNGLKLVAEVVRREEKGAAVQFYFPDKESLVHLWNVIKDNIKDSRLERCPYCGHVLGGGERECSQCGLLCDLTAGDYLIEHLKRTALERLRKRLSRMKGKDLLSLLNFVDSMLTQQEQGEEDEEFVGTCEKMLEVFSLIRKVAPTDVPVLILGESGTGKELTAKAIHERSHRSEKPFVVINCAAIPETLLEAELFGYERGAFTSAYTSRKGRVEQAHGGTLFLDEIGELPPALQAKLLRFLEDGTVERIGSRKPRKVDVRIIAATNRDLEREVAEGRFREDLYYRLNVFTIHLPPLRERGEDKILLAKYFLKKLCGEDGHGPKRLEEDALRAIMGHSWPGNVREMINRIRRALVVSEREEISARDLDLTPSVSTPSPANPANASVLAQARASIEREKLLEAIKATGGNLSKAARLLGISRPTLYKLKRKYKL